MIEAKMLALTILVLLAVILALTATILVLTVRYLTREEKRYLLRWHDGPPQGMTPPNRGRTYEEIRGDPFNEGSRSCATAR